MKLRTVTEYIYSATWQQTVTHTVYWATGPERLAVGALLYPLSCTTPQLYQWSSILKGQCHQVQGEFRSTVSLNSSLSVWQDAHRTEDRYKTFVMKLILILSYLLEINAAVIRDISEESTLCWRLRLWLKIMRALLSFGKDVKVLKFAEYPLTHNILSANQKWATDSEEVWCTVPSAGTAESRTLLIWEQPEV